MLSPKHDEHFHQPSIIVAGDSSGAIVTGNVSEVVVLGSFEGVDDDRARRFELDKAGDGGKGGAGTGGGGKSGSGMGVGGERGSSGAGDSERGKIDAPKKSSPSGLI